MKSKVLLLAVCLLAAGCSSHPKTALYERYEGRKDVKAACMIGYELEEGCKVDVTLLQSPDSIRFAHLMKELGLTQTSLGAERVILTARAKDAQNRTVVQTMGASCGTRTVFAFQCDTTVTACVMEYLNKQMMDYMDSKNNIL